MTDAHASSTVPYMSTMQMDYYTAKRAITNSAVRYDDCAPGVPEGLRDDGIAIIAKIDGVWRVQRVAVPQPSILAIFGDADAPCIVYSDGTVAR